MVDNILSIFGQSESDVLHRVINNTYIIEMGIIKDIPKEGIVTVEMSVATNKQNIVITNCILANIASSSFSVKVTPNIDDKVLVLFPRKFAGKMFNPKENEPIVSDVAAGYSITGGIAVLLNQFQQAYHNNSMLFEDGTTELKLAYDENSSKNLLTVTTNKDGEIELKSNDNFSLNTNKDGELAVKSNNNFSLNTNKDGELEVKSNNTDIKISKSNTLEIATGKAKVSIDSSGNVTIDAMTGKVSIKNSITSLYSILNGMLQILNSSLATAGSPTAQTVVPQQFAVQSTLLGQLMT